MYGWAYARLPPAGKTRRGWCGCRIGIDRVDVRGRLVLGAAALQVVTLPVAEGAVECGVEVGGALLLGPALVLPSVGLALLTVTLLVLLASGGSR